jgi:uncharacterized protein YllA (UPF0747 family)
MIEEKKESIKQEIIKVNRSMKEVAEYTEDKEKYKECIERAQKFMKEVLEES